MADQIAGHPGGERPAWLRAAGGALALHVAVIGGAMLTMTAPPVTLPAAAPFQVTMLPAPPTDIPPGIVQDESAPEPVEQPEMDLPITPPPEATAPAALQVPKPTERPAPSAAAPIRPAQTAATTTTRPPAAPVAQAAPPAPPAAAPASGAAAASWQARLLAQLERSKRYPAKARYFRQQDTVFVRFTMSREGRVLSSTIVKSQGFAEIDAEVLALLKRAQPLVAPPPDVAGDTLTQTVAIQFYLT